MTSDSLHSKNGQQKLRIDRDLTKTRYKQLFAPQYKTPEHRILTNQLTPEKKTDRHMPPTCFSATI